MMVGEKCGSLTYPAQPLPAIMENLYSSEMERMGCADHDSQWKPMLWGPDNVVFEDLPSLTSAQAVTLVEHEQCVQDLQTGGTDKVELEAESEWEEKVHTTEVLLNTATEDWSVATMEWECAHWSPGGERRKEKTIQRYTDGEMAVDLFWRADRYLHRGKLYQFAVLNSALHRHMRWMQNGQCTSLQS